MNKSKVIQNIEKKIFSKSYIQYFDSSAKWINKITPEAGLYAFFKNDKIVYVGESGSLKARMRDATHTVNHPLRRTIGKIKYKNVEGYREATSLKKFPDHIENKINKYMKTLSVVIIPVYFGRLEIEEYIVEKFKPMFNNKIKRKTV